MNQTTPESVQPGVEEGRETGSETPLELPESPAKLELESKDVPVATKGAPDNRKPYTTEESVFKASKKAHKSQAAAEVGGGRPRNDGITAGMAAPVVPLKLPRPKFSVFKSDSTNGSQRTKSFYNYWNDLPNWAKEKTILYVYRDWPVLRQIPEDSDEYAYIDKISGEEPLQDDMDLLNRYGCGRYKLMFNEQPGGNLCVAYSWNLGNDMKSFPPTDRRISDVNQVDLSHPDNRSYVEFLRMRGKLKDEGENEDMATSTVVEKVLEQNAQLTKTVMDRAEKQSNTPAPKDTSGPGTEDAMRLGAKIFSEGLQTGRAAATPLPTAPQAPASDPMEIALRIVDLLRDGKDKNDPEVTELRRMVDKMREDQVTMLREEIKAIREGNKTTASTSNPFTSLQEGMEALKKMRDLQEEISGSGGGGGKDVVEEVAGAVGPKWLQQYAPLLQQGMTLFDSFLRYRSAMSGAPNPYPPPPGYPQNPQGYPQPQASNPIAAPQPIAAPPLPPGFPPELANLLMRISVSLRTHLIDPEATGTEFANWFIGGEGEASYQDIISFGPEQIVQALQIFPATGVTLSQVTPERTLDFVTEFCSPKWDDDEEDTEEEPEDGSKGPIGIDTPKVS